MIKLTFSLIFLDFLTLLRWFVFYIIDNKLFKMLYKNNIQCFIADYSALLRRLMDVRYKRYVFRLLLLFFFQGVFGKAKVTLQLIDYKNTGSKSWGGGCCDGGYLICPLKCDNWFEICVKQIPMKTVDPCIETFQTKVLYDNDDDFYFPGFEQSLGKDLKNPLVLTYDGPLVSKNIFIQISNL